ncbi:MAG: 30S ribosomal protein S12 methylthiotransferase RimO [Coriobacteriia bacterium]|nr:30S ribosomal protein S12 methylthiotransferase RimO [Coriobacteriia bacterium]
MSTIANKLYFDTLGCAKNHVDTNHMIDDLSNNGYAIVDNPDVADIIILNTCAFIEAATSESIDTFFDYKNQYPEKKIVVAGCLVSRYKDDLKKSLSEADMFISCNQEENIVDILGKLNEIGNKPEENKSYEYVKISEGCNRFCSYCTIPFIRGRYKSILYEDIARDVKKTNAKEIVLVAQDCGAWGSDIGSKLSYLLDKLAKDFPNKLFRVLYIQPDAIDKDLIAIFKFNKNIVNYFDVPIQHVSSRLLKSMNRKPLNNFYDLIKSNIPDAKLRTTIIVGYPGETEEDFEELCDFINKDYFDYVGIFKYSQEEGTKAAKLDNQVDEDTKNRRFNILRDICDSLSLGKIDKYIGTVQQIIVEGAEDDRMYGRCQFQAPDVDGVVYFPYTKNINIGETVSVKIKDSELYDLVGELIEVD